MGKNSALMVQTGAPMGVNGVPMVKHYCALSGFELFLSAGFTLILYCILCPSSAM